MDQQTQTCLDTESHGEIDDIGSRIAVCVHVFYIEVARRMFSVIDKFSDLFDLYVTCNYENYQSTSALLYSHFRDFNILIVDNIGMDVVPFVKAIHKFGLHEYLAVVKLHTKSARSTTGALLGEVMLRRNFGSKKTILELKESFANLPRLMIAGPNDLFKDGSYMMYNNRRSFGELTELMGKDGSRPFGFFAGTMFWIRGSVVGEIGGCYKRIEAKVLSEARELAKTGGDGSLAHALERIWAVLIPEPDFKVGLVYQKDMNGSEDVVRIEYQSIALREPLRRVGASDFAQIYANAISNTRSIRSNPLFDADYYSLQIQDIPNPGIDPALHFVFYGATLGRDPSASFKTSFYRLNRPDVVRQGINVLTHYTNSGRREGMIVDPTREDWVRLARKLKLFDNAFYKSVHGALVDAFKDPIEHYCLLGRHTDKATSLLFGPDPVHLSSEIDPNGRVSLDRFLHESYLEEERVHHEIIRVVENNDFVILFALAEYSESRFGATAATLCAKCLYLASVDEWDALRPLLRVMWQRAITKSERSRHIVRLTPRIRQINLGNKVLVEQAPAPKPGAVCVYTALFGDIDDLPPVLSHRGDLKFICFSDQDRNVEGWSVIKVASRFADPNLDAKMYKVLAHIYLGEYDYSLFVDANTVFHGRLEYLVNRLLIASEFAMWVHPERNDIYIETVAIVECARHEPDLLLKQVEDYRSAGMPHNAGMYEASFIWRSHRSASVCALMTDWWEHIQKYSKRDQLSLAFLLWKSGNHPQVVPDWLGTSRDNSIFWKLPHVKLPFEVEHGSPPSLKSGVGRKIYILYGSRMVASGSTVLRGQQLGKIIESLSLDNIQFAYTSFAGIRNAVIICNKSFLAQHGEPGVVKLKELGNFVLLDPVDLRLGDPIVDLADCLVACSLEAYRYYRTRWPDKKCFHVTHHVDLRLDRARKPLESTQIGYFGELVNTIVPAGDIDIDFVNVDTSRASDQWMNKLPDYNCHYAVRRRRNIDGYKPFLKGFTAAHFSANIIIQNNAGDAMSYLGPDYPYLLSAEPSESEILEMVAYVRESFGSPEWARGLDIMAEVKNRSCVEAVKRELNFMLSQIF